MAEVGTLQLAGVRRDDAGLRSWALGTVGSADVSSSIPPAAVLIVRRLDDPHPGALSRERVHMRVPAQWEQSLRASIADLYAGAARPARGPVDPDAAAVVFADEAEMLACLIRDVVGSEVGNRWWWRHVRHRYAPLEPVTLLSAIPQLVPAVVSQLYRQGAALAVLRGIEPARARELSLTVAVAHDLAPLVRTIECSSEDHARPVHGVETEEPAGDRFRSAGPPPGGTRLLSAGDEPSPAPAAPWARWLALPAAYSVLGPEQSLLLALSLSIRHHAAHVRSTRFRTTLARWLRSQAQMSDATDSPAAREPGASGSPRPRRSGDRAPEAAETRRDRGARVGRPAGPPEGAARPVVVRARPTGAIGSMHTRPAGPPGGSTSPESPPGAVAGVGKDAAPAADTAVEPDAGEPPEVQERPEGVASDLAGTVFLLHVVLPLLAGSPRRAGGWDAFEAVTRGLLEEALDETAAEAAASDALWPTLASLAGRGPRAALPAGRQATAYRVPVGLDLARARSYWSTNGRRVAVWTSLGFVVSEESPAGGEEPADAAARVCAQRGLPLGPRRAPADAPRSALAGDLCAPVRGPLRKWTSLAVPYLRWALAGSLDMAPDDAVRHVACRPGNVYATATHLDVVFDVDSISVPVRLAGMDADPGWLPDLGCAVAFHFD